MTAPLPLLYGLFVGALATASPAAGPTAPVPTSATSSAPSAAPQLSYQAILNQRTAELPGSGLVVATVENGKTTIRTAGTSGTSRPLDARTLFEIGSVTKTFTATILATMVLDGSVRLDDPIQKFLPKSVHAPSFHGRQITLLDLATQHSGLPRLPPNMTTTDSPQPYESYTVPMLYDSLNHYKLTRAPGATFEYSNYGVALLGQLLANRAGTSYAELLHRRVLAPLGMNDTFLVLKGGLAGETAARRARFAAGLTIDGDPSPPWTFDSIAPAGALASSADDMLKFLRCNMGAGPLAKACLFAQTPRTTMPGNHIGLVWWTGDRTHVIIHGGDTMSYHAAVAIAPGHRRGVIVLANGGLPVQDLAERALTGTSLVAHAPPTAQITGLKLADYAGTYEDKADKLTYTVEVRGDKLMAKLSGQGYARIYPTAQDTFAYHVVAAKVAFTRTAAGAVNAAVLFQDGQHAVFVKPGMEPPAKIPEPFPSAIALTPANLAEYVGNYTSTVGTFYVTLGTTPGDQLSVRLSSQPAFPIYASAKDSFYYKVVDAQITFVRDATGKISGLTLHQNGADIPAKRQ